MQDGASIHNPRKRADYWPPLYRLYPELEEAFPRVFLGDFPTPVQRLSGLNLGNIWIKRDDLSAGIYGGNKIRKLEYVLADALKKGCNRVITMGGIGTNHGLATAIYCHKLGLPCRILLFKQPLNSYVRRNMLLFLKYGAELVYLKGILNAGISLFLLQRLMNPRAYILDAGGSSPLGTIGFVAAMFELKEQIEAGILPEPRRIFCPLGSSGTMAGLSLGAMLAGLSTEVVGVRVTVDAIGPIAIANEKSVATLMGKTLKLMRSKSPGIPDITIPPQKVIHGYVGRGYGFPTKECIKAVNMMKEREGIALEPTYSAKAFAAFCDSIATSGHDEDPMLFWHTYNSRDMTAQAQSVDYHGLPPVLRELYETKDGEDF